jgi:NADH:ubiquinone reductase (H+-translocating)
MACLLSTEDVSCLSVSFYPPIDQSNRGCSAHSPAWWKVVAGSMARPRIVIIGGGFGGLNAARELARHPFDVTVVDRRNHHTFQPLLYQVATTMLSPGQIATPLRGILRRYPNISVVLAEVTGVNLAERRVLLGGGGSLAYDYLVVAAGATHSYFGHEDWQPQAPGLKTIEDATEIRRRILLTYELAERDALASPKAQPAAGGHVEAPPTFVIVGGGPTGVELAGALIDLARRVLPGNFRAIRPEDTRVVLLEAASRVLPTYPEDLSRQAAMQLRALGVDVRVSSPVTSIQSGVVFVRDTAIPCGIALWTAGVAASPLGAMLAQPADRAGRVRVEPDLSLPGHPEVFVIGDMALLDGSDGKPLPGLAAVAVQQGKAAAVNVARRVRGAPTLPFRYHDKGTLATIGRGAAVADLGSVHLSGLAAWLIWLFVHIMLLVGFRNRLMVLAEWSWSYFTAERSARLITGGPSF